MPSRRSRSAALALALAASFLCVTARAQAPAGADVDVAQGAAGPPTLKPAADVSRFLGLPITRIDVVLDDDTWSDVRVPAVKSVRAGEGFEPFLARRALDEVLATGRFAQGRVSVVADGTGVRLVVHGVPRKLVETLHIDMHGARIPVDELRRGADLSEGGELVATQIPEMKKAMTTVFARHGYLSPTVALTTRATDVPERVIVLIDIVPGAASTVRRRVFYVSGADVSDVVPAESSYTVGPGDRIDETTLEAADLSLENRLRALGYHEAKVSHDIVIPDGVVTLRVRVDAGLRFLAHFEGNDHFDADALSGALDLEDETDRTPGHLLQKLQDFYVKHGFLDAEVTLETRGDPARAKQAYLVFHIVERKRVSVVSRAYPCLRESDIKGLDDAPTSASAIGSEIDSYLDDELPGQDLFVNPNPAGLDELLGGASTLPRGSRPVPIDLDPDATYAPDTYERAVLHLQELYRNAGFLKALVGPVQVIRRRCSPRSPANRCIPVKLPHPPVDACTYDATGLPLPVQPGDPALSCTPDPAHGVECEPFAQLRIPIKLGPRSMLYDLSFSGARSLSQKALADAAGLTLGDPVNTIKLDEARRHIADAYKEEGFAYVDVKYSLDQSLDHTRARARFDIVEGDRVIVRGIVVRGNERTSASLIRSRVALEIGKPYRTSDVRKTEERIATLNVFSSVSVSLEDAYVPQASKTVIINVVERLPQSVEVRPGVSTGEGLRFAFEYQHRNLFGNAIGLTLQIQLSYLPDFLIYDDQIRRNFDSLGNPGLDKRLATRSTASVAFPDIGLGPLVRASIDGVFVRDLERDFALTKEAGILNLFYRPFRQLQFKLSPDAEANDANVFGFSSVDQYLQSLQQGGAGANADLSRLLRVPTGASDALAQRFVITWDRRDNSFNAHTGTYLVSGVEHVDWKALEQTCLTQSVTQAVPGNDLLVGVPASVPVKDAFGHQICEPDSGHFLRFTETLAAYLPVTKTITLAGEIRMGANVQTVPGSSTYPDRLFFLGGIESVRGYLQEAFVPQEYADQIARDFNKSDSDPTKFTINQVALRGGNLMINPRVELRVPVHPPFETVLFVDSGNLWVDPTYFIPTALGGKGGAFTLRTSAGTGIRVQTPIGPLALDYGVNISRLVSSPSDPRRFYEDFGAINFAIGLF